jgi:hypothetical protein
MKPNFGWVYKSRLEPGYNIIGSVCEKFPPGGGGPVIGHMSNHRSAGVAGSESRRVSKWFPIIKGTEILLYNQWNHSHRETVENINSQIGTTGGGAERLLGGVPSVTRHVKPVYHIDHHLSSHIKSRHILSVIRAILIK